jgi:hypothetical protein
VGLDFFRYVAVQGGIQSLIATVYVKVLNFKYVVAKTVVRDRISPDGQGKAGDKAFADEQTLQAELRRTHAFDQMYVIPRTLSDRDPSISVNGTSGFVIGIKGGYKVVGGVPDFSKLTVTLVPYAILYAEVGPQKIHFPGGPTTPQMNESGVHDGPSSIKDHELWHTDGEPSWVSEKVRHRLPDRRDPVTGIGFVGGFNREMARIATQLGAFKVNDKGDKLYAELLSKIQLSLDAITKAGTWHATSTREPAHYDIIID